MLVHCIRSRIARSRQRQLDEARVTRTGPHVVFLSRHLPKRRPED